MGILDNLKNALGGRKKDAAGDGEAAPPANDEAIPSKPSTESARSLPHGHAHEYAEAKTYTVQSGDTLFKIAKEFYGDGEQYLRIFEANRGVLEDPERVEPGQELQIPPKED